MNQVGNIVGSVISEAVAMLNKLIVNIEGGVSGSKLTGAASASLFLNQNGNVVEHTLTLTLDSVTKTVKSLLVTLTGQICKSLPDPMMSSLCQRIRSKIL